ncbi:hypothetical protein, partial [Thiolapillus sp.]|uniref:hypothetical protein n=2 Tax=Thiolapillus sp. TaxID=2017437 RepID=UPI003AF5656F
MNQTRNRLSTIWNHFQTSLFPWLKEELGELTEKHQQLVEVLEMSQIDAHIPYVVLVPGRPMKNRCAIARAFVAKAVYNMPTTEILSKRDLNPIYLFRPAIVNLFLVDMPWQQLFDLFQGLRPGQF